MYYWSRFYAYTMLLLTVGNSQSIHCTDHRLHGHEYVLENIFGELLPLLVQKSVAVNDAHLFDECGLARFTCACDCGFVGYIGHRINYSTISLTQDQ